MGDSKQQNQELQMVYEEQKQEVEQAKTLTDTAKQEIVQADQEIITAYAQLIAQASSVEQNEYNMQNQEASLRTNLEESQKLQKTGLEVQDTIKNEEEEKKKEEENYNRLQKEIQENETQINKTDAEEKECDNKIETQTNLIQQNQFEIEEKNALLSEANIRYSRLQGSDKKEDKKQLLTEIENINKLKREVARKKIELQNAQNLSQEADQKKKRLQQVKADLQAKKINLAASQKQAAESINNLTGQIQRNQEHAGRINQLHEQAQQAKNTALQAFGEASRNKSEAYRRTNEFLVTINASTAKKLNSEQNYDSANKDYLAARTKLIDTMQKMNLSKIETISVPSQSHG